MEKCFQEAVRYLGYGKNPVDEATSRLVEKGFLELEKVSALRSVFRIFEMNRIDEEKVAIGTLQISSKSLARNLNHCEKAVLFGATLGTGVDRLIARTSLTDMANAVVLQACAAAMLEEFCDEKQFEIGEELEKEGLYLRPRFSPGYGDFDIGFQKSFMQMLDCAKAIGLTMTESFMMTFTLLQKNPAKHSTGMFLMPMSRKWNKCRLNSRLSPRNSTKMKNLLSSSQCNLFSKFIKSAGLFTDYQYSIDRGDVHENRKNARSPPRRTDNTEPYGVRCR